MAEEEKDETTKVVQKLVWRLKSAPTVEEIEKLVNLDVLKKEEAREILIKFEKEEEADPLTLSRIEKELEFLRGLVLKVMSEGTTTNTIIKYIERPEWQPYRFEWNRPYMQMANTMKGLPAGTIFSMSSIASGASGGGAWPANYVSDETGAKVNAVRPDTAGFAGTSDADNRYIS